MTVLPPSAAPDVLIARLQRAVERLNECEFRKRRAEVERDAALAEVERLRRVADDATPTRATP